jgi:penicillin-binding protein 2
MRVQPVLNRVRFFVLITVLFVTSSVMAQQSPDAVVESFLSQWAEKNYAGMYQLVYVHRIDNQPEFPENVFVQRYTQADTALGITGIRYNIRNTQLQGQSALVHYDVVIQTSGYGDIPDADRMMRLVNINGTWQIAWSTQDIFEGLTNGGEIRVQAQSSGRAAIYDRNGQVLAQDGGRTVGMETSRQNMASEQQCAATVAAVALEPIANIQARWANLLPDTQFFLAEVTEDVFNANQSRLEADCGIIRAYTSQPHRIYYGGGAVVHVTGYVSQVQSAQEESRYGAGQLIGRDGVEGYYNDLLSGQADRVIRIIGPNGTTMRELASATGTPPTPIQLTIDRDLQVIVAQAMNDAFNYAANNWGSTRISPGGAAVVIDVTNGDILAMFSYPTYNPSLYNTTASLSREYGTDGLQTFQAAFGRFINDPRRPTVNRATAEQYSTGSTFKLITAAAALNEGVWGLEDLFDCQLSWDASSRGDTASPRRDWRAVSEGFSALGEVTPAEAIMASCNPFFYEMGVLLHRNIGAGAIADYSRRMGLLQTYLGGVVREVTGNVPSANSVTDAVNIAIGQGDVAVPPLQMAVMTAGLANDGVIYRPRLIQRVGGLDGAPLVEETTPEILAEMGFNEGVIETIQEGMCGVTTVPGVGTAFGRFVSGDPEWSYVSITAPYSSCGKTGTATVNRDPNAWYVAYAPADNPQIAVVVMVEQSLEGSQVSAPIVRRILDGYFDAPVQAYPDWWEEEFVPLSSSVPQG